LSGAATAICHDPTNDNVEEKGEGELMLPIDVAGCYIPAV
jgi:hypothetical protein